MFRWIVTESGPNGQHEILCESFEEAEDVCQRGLDFWKDMVIHNSVPARTYTIRKYKQVIDDNLSDE